jgi:hypothetical protein
LSGVHAGERNGKYAVHDCDLDQEGSWGSLHFCRHFSTFLELQNTSPNKVWRRAQNFCDDASMFRCSGQQRLLF